MLIPRVVSFLSCLNGLVKWTEEQVRVGSHQVWLPWRINLQNPTNLPQTEEAAQLKPTQLSDTFTWTTETSTCFIINKVINNYKNNSSTCSMCGLNKKLLTSGIVVSLSSRLHGRIQIRLRSTEKVEKQTFLKRTIKINFAQNELSSLNVFILKLVCCMKSFSSLNRIIASASPQTFYCSYKDSLKLHQCFSTLNCKTLKSHFAAAEVRIG